MRAIKCDICREYEDCESPVIVQITSEDDEYSTYRWEVCQQCKSEFLKLSEKLRTRPKVAP